MKTARSKQTGFSPIEASIIVVVIAIIAVVGVVLYQRQTSNNRPTITTTGNQQKGTANGQPPQTTPNPNEFTVTELGFKLILPDGIKDLKYTVTGSSAYFTTTTLEQLDGAGSQCTAANGAIGAISRLSQDPKTTGGSYITSKAVGSFYLTYNTPQQGCSRNTATNQLQLSQAKLLQQALDTATPTN